VSADQSECLSDTVSEEVIVTMLYCPQMTSWSLRGVNARSAVRGSTEHAGGRNNSYWSAIKRRSDS
jgi:hypothetical protein